MIIARIDRDAVFGEIVLRKGVDYVMADAIAHMIKDQAAHVLERFDTMKDEYKKYEGEDLSGKSIVIWRTGGFGDLLFVSSLVHHLKKRYPTSTINVATSKRFHDIWEGNADINRLASPGILPIPLNFLTKHDYQLKFEGTIESDTDPEQLPAVDRFAAEARVKLADIERLPYYPGAIHSFTTARNHMRKFGLELKPLKYGCIQFKSSSIVRDWRYTRMIELADMMASMYNMPILLLGNDFYHEQIADAAAKYKEEKQVQNINRLAIDTTPSNMRFLYSAALVASAAFVVTIDSALVHVAASSWTPCVSLYGPFPGKIRTQYYTRNITLENKGTCGPYPNGCLQHTQAGPQNVLPTRTHCGEEIQFCRMMDSISVQDVMTAVEEALGRWGHETMDDRQKMFHERKNYEPERV